MCGSHSSSRPPRSSSESLHPLQIQHLLRRLPLPRNRCLPPPPQNQSRRRRLPTRKRQQLNLPPKDSLPPPRPRRTSLAFRSGTAFSLTALARKKTRPVPRSGTDFLRIAPSRGAGQFVEQVQTMNHVLSVYEVSVNDWLSRWRAAQVRREQPKGRDRRERRWRGTKPKVKTVS